MNRLPGVAQKGKQAVKLIVVVLAMSTLSGRGETED